MGWVRISDDFYDHPAHAVLGLEEWGLWVWGLAWSNRNLTDGKIPWPVVRRMDPDGDATGALMEAGRWIDYDEGDVVIHDYLEYQPAAAQIRAKREKERERWQRRADSTSTPRGVAPDSAAVCDVPNPNPNPNPKVKNTSAATAAVPYAADFAEWYKGYPRKREQGKARTAYQARRRAGTSHADLIAARDNYAAHVAGVEPHLIKYPASFLNGNDGPWSEWVDGPPEPPFATGGVVKNPEQFTVGHTVRAVLGRGVDAAPVWELDDKGEAVAR